jgi:hypothetical protein
MQIRVQTVDGDVCYFPIRVGFVHICSGSTMLLIDELFLRDEYFPEYRLQDLTFTFCEVT